MVTAVCDEGAGFIGRELDSLDLTSFNEGLRYTQSLAPYLMLRALDVMDIQVSKVFSAACAIPSGPIRSRDTTVRLIIPNCHHFVNFIGDSLFCVLRPVSSGRSCFNPG